MAVMPWTRVAVSLDILCRVTVIVCVGLLWWSNRSESWAAIFLFPAGMYGLLLGVVLEFEVLYLLDLRRDNAIRRRAVAWLAVGTLPRVAWITIALVAAVDNQPVIYALAAATLATVGIFVAVLVVITRSPQRLLR